MKPEIILRSTLLDIIFDNRNKEYGAYQLRKEYNSRLTKALAITFISVMLLLGWQMVKSHFFPDRQIGLTLVNIQDSGITISPPPMEKPKAMSELPKATKQMAEKVFVTPLIVKDKEETSVTEMKALEHANIGTKDVDGEAITNGPALVTTGAGSGSGGTTEGVSISPEEVEITAPLNKAEYMPEFPGGTEAFLKYMHRNLKQPDDIAAGEKVVIKVRFVVGTDGSITDAYVVQSGGHLDKDVLRVINKMPKWKPGEQNGRKVPVYFNLPVTFLGTE